MSDVAKEYVIEPFRPPVNLQIDYAKELNPQQHAAVTAPPGPALVIAGAGSGKTRTLIYRVAFLLEQGIPPERILLLTFTNKAAKEMMRRVTDLVGIELRDLCGGTFHSIGARILRTHAELLGYRRDFTILDREDSRDLVKACLGEPGVDTERIVFPKPDVLVDLFSMAVNKYGSMAEALEKGYPQFDEIRGAILDLAERFKARKLANNVMDFDDLLTQWLRLLSEQPHILDYYQRRFQFILVDEYQDTNTIQGQLIDLLAARHKNVMVVGDDSQSIYSWRGANFLNILDFPKRYPGSSIYKIETNYRSTPEILDLANAAIAPNRNQFQKKLVSDRRSSIKPVVIPCSDASAQSGFICQRIMQLREEGVSLDQMAVIYRSHFHAMELQLELTRRNIPFAITSGIRFFEQAHIKDLVSFLRLLSNPTDELAFGRMVQMLPGVGAKAAQKLWALFRAQPVLQQVASNTTEAKPSSETSHPLAVALQRCSSAVPKKALVAWAQLTATIAQVAPLRTRPAEQIRLLISAVYEDYLKENFENYRSRLEDVEQLGIFAHQFSDLESFLTQLSLLTNMESDEENAKRDDDTERVRLTTIHQAKGLEYDVVFVIMLCDGLFPSSRSMESEDGEEEERRLFYVAVTRARNELYLTFPLYRMMQGEGNAIQMKSRFLLDLPHDLYEEWNLRESTYGGY